MIYTKADFNTPQTIYIPRSGVEVTSPESRLQDKDYNITENGDYTITPDSGYDGISGGTISVSVEGPGYDEGYASGYTDGEQAGYSSGYTEGEQAGEQAGEEAQKALLTSTTFTHNGIYQREDGWNEVTVDVEGGGGSAVLTAGTFTDNGEYTPEQGIDGWSAVTVNVPTSGGSANLTSETFTQNGQYTPSAGTDGWSAVTVNVPTSAGTMIPITAATFQDYQANSTGLYSFNITTADTLHSLTVYFPQSGVTHITAWYQDDNGYSDPTVLFNSSSATAWINSMSIDDGTPIAPSQTYYFGDSNTHKVVFDLTYADSTLYFADCSALTKVDLSEVYRTNLTSFQNCTKLWDVRAPRTESIDMSCFWNCTNFGPNVSQNFPLLKTIGLNAFQNSGVWYLGELHLDSIGSFAFCGCTNLQDCVLSYVKNVEFDAFAYCSFNDAHLPRVDGYSIGKRCFVGNTSLLAVSMQTPDDGGVANGTIHYEAFYNCSYFSQWNVWGDVAVPVIVDDNGDPTSNAFTGIYANGEINLNNMSSQYFDDWSAFATTYLPNWTINGGGA